MYSRDLAEFTKEKRMEMCPKDVVDIGMHRRDDGKNLMGLKIIGLKFETDIIEPHTDIPPNWDNHNWYNCDWNNPAIPNWHKLFKIFIKQHFNQIYAFLVYLS